MLSAQHIGIAGTDVSHVVLRITATSTLASARAALERVSPMAVALPHLIEVLPQAS